MMGARVPETCRAEYEYNKILMFLRLLCIWLVFYSLLSSLMHGTMNLKPFLVFLSVLFVRFLCLTAWHSPKIVYP
jgi:hypothetical protein